MTSSETTLVRSAAATNCLLLPRRQQQKLFDAEQVTSCSLPRYSSDHIWVGVTLTPLYSGSDIVPPPPYSHSAFFLSSPKKVRKQCFSSAAAAANHGGRGGEGEGLSRSQTAFGALSARTGELWRAMSEVQRMEYRMRAREPAASGTSPSVVCNYGGGGGMRRSLTWW